MWGMLMFAIVKHVGKDNALPVVPGVLAISVTSQKM